MKKRQIGGRVALLTNCFSPDSNSKGDNDESKQTICGTLSTDILG